MRLAVALHAGRRRVPTIVGPVMAAAWEGKMDVTTTREAQLSRLGLAVLLTLAAIVRCYHLRAPLADSMDAKQIFVANRREVSPGHPTTRSAIRSISSTGTGGEWS